MTVVRHSYGREGQVERNWGIGFRYGACDSVRPDADRRGILYHMTLPKRYSSGLNAFAYDAHIRYDRVRSRVRGREVDSNSEILLVHIPKCAGVSLRHALKLPNPGHRLLCDFSSDELAQARRIAFCTRDPFDRAVSAFYYLRRFREQSPLLHSLVGLPRPRSFTEFVHSTNFARLEAYHYFFRSQFQYLKGIEDHRSKAVHLRFETLGEDFERNFGSPLPRMNATCGMQRDDDIDTPENRERVKRVYRADYDLLPALLGA